LPDIELEIGYGTIGGVFTTVEGLLEKIHNYFEESSPFVDSDQELAARIFVLLQDLSEMSSGKRLFTMIMIGPSHSFISNPFIPNEDTRLNIEFCPRTFEENEDLGLNGFNADNYKIPNTVGKAQRIVQEYFKE
jgi:zinc finger protein